MDVWWDDWISNLNMSFPSRTNQVWVSNRAADSLSRYGYSERALGDGCDNDELVSILPGDQEDLELQLLGVQRYFTFQGLDEIDQDLKKSVKKLAKGFLV